MDYSHSQRIETMIVSTVRKIDKAIKLQHDRSVNVKDFSSRNK